ncbi:DUF305 domain-containing protein [Actinomarinicola tropica]|jgi:uncharacterized protein (DUF305 family)|uniref:DUF305 domain-containing protein n=1 Tax=Actinomarinicola tropica TaxID=2789776 RepID=A0A5Q2RLS3_9ACTN|nr:DUF305 domain-containing protein [Actinomarinicola tropica]QGG94145.1 DUF305 domain-containing protein [Actinomarinicola tropica]
MTTPRHRRPLLILVAAAFFLAACGADSSDDPAMAPPAAEQDGADGSGAAEPNQADVEFTKAMIVHHEQAIEMAALAEDRAEAEEVRSLATRIGEAQQPEIDRMQEWLEAWGEDAAGASGDMDHGDMDMGGGDSMGMMSEEDMGQLEAASGPEFDRMFLEMMIQHHRGAISMAREVQIDGSHPDVLALAEDVVADQEAEVEEMEQLLADFGAAAE